jgi:hypothetical protein
MDKNTVLVRTPKGNDEVDNRTHKISIRWRAALLAVNGTDSFETIMKRFSGLDEMADALRELEAQGFLAAAGGGSTKAAAKPAPSAPAARPGADLADIVRKISHSVHDLLGPDGDVVTERLEEAAKDLKQIQPIVKYLEQRREMFEQMAGKQKAAAFFDELHKLTGV